MTTKKLALISEMKDVVIKLMERDLTFEQKRVYKEIYKDITNNNADYYDLKELKNKHKELVNLLKWSKLNAYPILTKEGNLIGKMTCCLKVITMDKGMVCM